MARPNGATIAQWMVNDNRTAVGSRTPGISDANDLVVAPLVHNGGNYIGGGTAKGATTANFNSGVPKGTGTINVPHGGGGLSAEDLRTQYFHSRTSYDATQPALGAKRCFVNAAGQPLDANGQPTTVEAALEVTAETTALSALGEAVTNWAQVTRTPDRTPPPGRYVVHRNDTSFYVPYLGWTVQHDA